MLETPLCFKQLGHLALDYRSVRNRTTNLRSDCGRSAWLPVPLFKLDKMRRSKRTWR